MLQILNLAHNSITTLPPATYSELTHLRKIYLQNNEIAALEGILFKNSSKLDSINLSGNKIKSISSQVFANLPELSILYIENNKLNSFDFDCLKSSTKLEEIHLHGSELTQIQGYRNLKGMLPALRE